MSSFLHLAGKSKKQDRARGATLPRASIAAILETAIPNANTKTLNLNPEPVEPFKNPLSNPYSKPCRKSHRNLLSKPCGNPMTGSTAAWDSKLRGLEAQGFGV